jgi:hypothetical protein
MSQEYFVKHFYEKTAFLVIFRAKGRETGHFRTFRAAWRAYLIYLTSPTTTPGPGTPSANSRYTKQFLSCPHGL